MAADLVGQVAYDMDSPAWLFTSARSLAECVIRIEAHARACDEWLRKYFPGVAADMA